MEKLIIIGSGPAGLTAAIYSARAKLNPIVLEGKEPGGQLTTTTLVENWPGDEAGVMGPQLVLNMRKQAQKFGAKMVTSMVIGVDLKNKPFKVITKDQTYETESLIIASGARARMLNLPRETELVGRGVHTCATCDGAFYRDKEVIIVGGGDAAMEEATFLTKFVTKVYLINRTEAFKASKPMLERAEKNEKIEFILNTEIKEYLGDQKLTGVKLINNQTNEEKSMKIDGLFLAIGHTPNTEFLQGQLDLVKHGYIEPKNNVFTDIEGVFVAGDVADWRYRQAITAAGLGCMAALEAEKYLAE